MPETPINEEEVKRFRAFLTRMSDANEYESDEFEVLDGVAVDCDWVHDADEPWLSISVVVTSDGFRWFTRGKERTLTDTGALGHGPNHGENVAMLIDGAVRDHFTNDYDQLVFEADDQLDPDAWLFHGSVPNPNAVAP